MSHVLRARLVEREFPGRGARAETMEGRGRGPLRCKLCLAVVAASLLWVGACGKPTEQEKGTRREAAEQEAGARREAAAPAAARPEKATQGVGESARQEPRTAEGPGGEAKAGARKVLIGVTLPLSGSLAAYGKSTREGIEMQVEQVNRAGGIDGAPIELVVENNEGDTTKSSEGLRKLIALNKVLAVVGPITSRNALAINREAQRKKVVLITPTATNDAVTKEGDYVFRACFADSFQGNAVARFAYEDLHLRSAAVFKDMTSDYSVGLCGNFSEAFAKLGGKMGEALSYKQGDTDFIPQLRKLRQSGAEALFVPGYPPELPLIVNQARELGLKATLLGADGWDNEDLVKNAGMNLVGSYFSAAFSPRNPSPEVASFLAMAKARGIENPGTFEALGFDAMGLVAAAARKANLAAAGDLAAQRAALKNALASLKDYKGATGTIAMQASGDPLKSLVILKYDRVNGKLDKTFVKAVNP